MAKEKYQLKEGVTIFYDDEIDLKVVAGKTVDIDPDAATGKTATALLHGTLVKVKSKKEEKQDDSTEPQK